MTDARATQVATEEWAQGTPRAQATQVAVEQWGLSGTVGTQAVATQVALEEWALASRTVDLAGNLGGSSSYGRFHYGIGAYSRVRAFAPVFSADLTVVAPTNLSGDIAPLIVFAADLDVHVNLIELVGDIAPQIDFSGSLTLNVNLASLEGSFGFTVLLNASSFVSGPLWAASEPCPAPPWAPSEPCPPSLWTPIGPCDAVAWEKSELCHG